MRLVYRADGDLDVDEAVDEGAARQAHVHLLADLPHVLRQLEFALAKEYFLPADLRVQTYRRPLFLVHGRLRALLAEKD